MKNKKHKDFLMEIWRSKNRFLSILFIVSLGVAFFSGIRASKPDMELSADRYYDDTGLMDLRIVGTLGLTEEDVNAVAGMEEISLAVGTYTKDVLCMTKEKEQVMRLFAMTEGINDFTLMEGRLPEKQGECLMDGGGAFQKDYRIGDTVQVYSGDEDELEDTLHTNTFTIVGIGTSSRFLSVERGTTGIGNGSLDGFMAVTADNFSLDYYTDIYALTRRGREMTAYSQEYDDYIEGITHAMEDELSEERSRIRFEGLVADANEELNDGREELAEKKEEADEKLADAAQEIEDAGVKIEDGKKDIAKGRADLEKGKTDLTEAEKDLADGKQKLIEKEQELADAKITLAEKEQELADAKIKLADSEKELRDGKKEIPRAEKKLEDGRNEYNQQYLWAVNEIEGGWAEYEYGLEQYEEGKALLEEQKEEYEEAGRNFKEVEKELDEAQRQAMKLQLDYWNQSIKAGQQELVKSKRELDAARRQLVAAQNRLDRAGQKIVDGEKELEEAKQDIIDGEQKIMEAHQEIADADMKIMEAHQDIADGEVKIQEAWAEIRDGEAKIPKARQDIAKGEADIAEAQKKLDEGEADLTDGKQEYEDAKTEAEEKIADAQKKIDDAQEDIDDLEEGEWFVLDRNAIQTYVEFGSDADRIGAIGEVFPFIFFLVAALVSLTTMTRMVEEQRLQIGTLKALGYGKWSIASKYILYAFFATMAGSVFGVAVGEKILPYVIMTAYFILYQNLPVILLPYHMNYAVMAAGLALTCTVMAAFLASYGELMATPAALMRPVPPKQGKRVLLERITPLWKRLNFIQKATVRNLFRYKKRCLMTIFGIGGCMALLLVGFGLRDSISTLGERQYNSIWTYDVQLGLDTEAKEAHKEALHTYLEQLGPSMRVASNIKDMIGSGVTKEAYLFVPEELGQIDRFVHLKNRLTGEAYVLQDDRVIITEKLATLLSLQPGDTITLKEEEDVRYTATVGAVAENYLQHYVYISPTLYMEIYGEEPEYNTAFLGLERAADKTEDELGKELLTYDAVASVVFIRTMRGQIEDMMESLDVVIWVLIISAGLLAFVVLYNLNNINVTERLRELATIKVLGFYDMELAAYVYRENIILTVLGSMFGAVLGYFLHRYVILTVEVDMLMFGRQMRPISYLYSILLTCAFSAFVNGIMYFRLKKIDMVESLKSVE